MKKIIGTSLLLLSAFFVQAQKNNPNDTITTNYQPSVLFSPLPYTEKGNEFHSANGEPGPKYWQNLVNYNLAVELDTTTKTLSGTAEITYVNNKYQQVYADNYLLGFRLLFFNLFHIFIY